MIKSFKDYLNEKLGGDASTGAMYKIAGGETGPNKDVRYKKTSNGWEVSKDMGKTWKKATPDHPSPMFNTQDIEMEMEMGSIVKA